MPQDAITTNEAQTASAPPALSEKEVLMERIVEAIKTCYDPEIPVDIWELGLIYRVNVNDGGDVEIDMTLTSPMCPVAGELPQQVQEAVQNADGVTTCKIDLVWEPPWRPDMMSDVAKIQLDMF
ncbi:iron-sulfur cluster assembly protein [Azospirillum sp. sgz301742]